MHKFKKNQCEIYELRMIEREKDAVQLQLKFMIDKSKRKSREIVKFEKQNVWE